LAVLAAQTALAPDAVWRFRGSGQDAAATMLDGARLKCAAISASNNCDGQQMTSSNFFFSFDPQTDLGGFASRGGRFPLDAVHPPFDLDLPLARPCSMASSSFVAAVCNDTYRRTVFGPGVEDTRTIF
jgi:hypothetical protein